LLPGAWRNSTFPQDGGPRLGRPTGIEPGMRFVLREGGHTIGAGVVMAVN
jgi:hypothetical protein